MKIYLVSTNEKVGWDDYDAIVVCAKSKKVAIGLAVAYCHNFRGNHVEAECLGTANRKQKEGEILSSFNAG